MTPQTDGAHSAVGFCVPVGRLRGDQLHELVRLAREYATVPEVRLTHQQNVLLPWIPNERVEALLAEPLAQELSPQPELFTRGLQTCTGKEFCGLAKVHTKDRAAEIARFLDTHVDQERPRRGLPPALRGLLVELRASTRSPTSASRACSRRSTASSSRRWTSASAAGSGPTRASATSCSRRSRTGTSTRRCCGSSRSTRPNHGEGETFRDFAGRTEPEWWTEQLTPEEVEAG